MRRVSPIFLLLMLLLPLVAPLLALSPPAASALPACCRRNGRHACAMSMAAGIAATTDTSIHWQAPRERCPFAPASLTTGHFHKVLAAPTAAAIYAGLASHPAGAVQIESRRRIARDRSRQKRGPPSLPS